MRTSAICASVLLAMSVTPSAAQTYPARPVRMIVANGPGSAPDVVARLLGAKLAESWGQNVVIDNRPGATGLIAAETLARSAPDGHTLFLSTMTQLISTLMYQRYMLATEFAPVTLVGTTPFALVVSASLPVFVASGKVRPLGVTYQKPTKLAPGLPPVADTLPGFELLGWYGMNVALRTPPEIVTRINAELVKALKNPELQERLFTVGAEAVGSSPAEFATFLQKQTEHWAKILHDSGARSEKAGAGG